MIEDWSPRQATKFGLLLTAVGFLSALAAGAVAAGVVALVEHLHMRRRAAA